MYNKTVGSGIIAVPSLYMRLSSRPPLHLELSGWRMITCILPAKLVDSSLNSLEKMREEERVGNMWRCLYWKKESSKIKEEQVCEKAESNISYTAMKMLSSASIGASRQRNRREVIQRMPDSRREKWWMSIWYCWLIAARTRKMNHVWVRWKQRERECKRERKCEKRKCDRRSRTDTSIASLILVSSTPNST